MADRPRTHHQRKLQQMGGRSGEDRRYDRLRRARDPVLAYARKYRSSRAWRVKRARKLKRTPLCETCSTDERPVPATTVDHVLQLHPAHLEREHYSNLASQCVPCHAAKSAAERAAS